MISTFSDLLEEIKNQGIAEIEPYLNIGHNPTIGDMYEGLTKEILNKAIFKELGLKVKSGKIKNNKGGLSKQIDCMIVVGEGEREEIPFTGNWIYHINDVIAVIEVKKNLFKKEIASSYKNLKSVRDTFEARGGLELSQVIDSYRGIFGEDLPEEEEVNKLPYHKKLVYHTLALESYLPLRIVLGYEGYKDEFELRKNFIKYLNENQKKEGFGALNLPSLIISNDLSLIKLNGMPYSIRTNDENLWAFYASYGKNSMLILLEVIWTRLSYKYKLGSDIFGSNFKVEKLNTLLIGRAIKNDKYEGWEYIHKEVSDEELKIEHNKNDNWAPANVTMPAYVIFKKICEEGYIDLQDEKLKEWSEIKKFNLDEVKQEVINTGLVYKDKDGYYCLSTKACICVIAQEGFLVGENIDGRFTKYLSDRSL